MATFPAAAIPDIYSFITVRREAFGGFLFNPYMFSEVSLNPIEYRILEATHGNNTVDELSTLVSRDFNVAPESARTIVDEALQRFNSHYAIHWRKEKVQGVPVEDHSTDVPSQPGSSSFIEYFTAPLSVIFELTHRCNLECPHCLVSAGAPENNELTLDEIKDILDQLKNMKVFTVNFGGGEPLLRKDIFEILQHASDLHMGIVISTNGYLVNEDVIDRLENINAFSVQISVDGLESTHDAFRGKKGSFRKAVDALKAFADRGYFTTMSTMILKDNKDQMEELIQLCQAIGVTSFKLSSFMPAGRGQESSYDYSLTRDELKVFAGQMNEIKERYSDSVYIDDKATYSFLEEIENDSSDPGDARMAHRIGCSAGRSSLVISPTGEAFPCPFLLSEPAGDLRQMNLSQIWENSDILKVFRHINSSQLKGKCKNCHHIPLYCQGGCRAAAYLVTGDLYGEDPFCWC